MVDKELRFFVMGTASFDVVGLTHCFRVPKIDQLQCMQYMHNV